MLRNCLKVNGLGCEFALGLELGLVVVLWLGLVMVLEIRA